MTHHKHYFDDNDKDIVIPSYNIPEPYSSELYAMIERIDKDIGLKDGPTALYWHLVPIFDIHTKGD